MSGYRFKYFQLHFKSFIFFLIISFPAMAQVSGQGKSQRPDSSQRKMPAIGKVTGVVLDSASGKPAEFASVALIRARDSFPAAGALANEKGNFTLEEVPFGRFFLKISSLGFKDYTSKELKITPNETNINLGKIFIHSTAKRLKEAEVTGEKSEYVNSLDKKVYNLDKNIVNTGGTATEVLRNIPSVTVDMDGNISLRGSGNVTVLIDGKPSSITGSSRQAILQQVPASSIESIEVITNPSAKYDADGMAGIINIITKKDKLKGLNANAAVGVGTNEKYNIALGGNYRTKKFNIFSNYSYRHEMRTSTSESERENFYGDSIFYDLSQSHGNSISDMQVGKAGLDYYLNETSTVSAGITATKREESRPEYIQYQSENVEHAMTSSFNRNNEEESANNTYDYSIDYRKTFRNGKSELTASATYSTSDRKSDDVYNTYTDVQELTLQQFIGTKTENSIGTYQANYSQPIGRSGKIETGWKSIIRSIDSYSNGLNYIPASDTFQSDPRFTDYFIYDEQIHALYAMYTGKWKKFDYQLGVRGEDYLNSGNSYIENIDFDNEYLNAYPSGFLKYHLSKTQETQLSYSRRVNRPESRSLNPFTDYSDTLNIRKGNPELKPEYIDSYELGYLKNFDKHSINFTLYYRYTHNLITRLRTLDQTTNVTTTTFTNFSSSENTGVEIVIKNQIGEFISVMTSGNLYYNKVNGSNIESDLQSTSTNWNARASINAKLTRNTSLQVLAMYMAPVTQPQGSFKGMSGVDAGMRQEFWKGKGSLSLNVNDIFNTRKMVIRTTGDGFTQDMTRTRESRVAMLTFTYRFGSADYAQRKRNQQTPAQQQDQNNMMDDF
jgi:outer membrane receptor protein involved in Fe transport